MMSNPWIAALIACGLWWFSTGAILRAVALADNRRPGVPTLVCIAALPLLIFGAILLDGARTDISVAGDYRGFIGALAVWAWIELAFLTGVITGPNSVPCPAGLGGWDRFWRSFGAIAYHEAALVAALVVIFHSYDGAANSTGLMTFALLFGARVSAKLNLFFGVPRDHADLLPRQMAHLASHFRNRRMNPFFPVSVGILTWITVICVLETVLRKDIGFALVGTLSALALIEHLMMVLPLPDEKLWRWMLPARAHNKTPEPLKEDANGI